MLFFKNKQTEQNPLLLKFEKRYNDSPTQIKQAMDTYILCTEYFINTLKREFFPELQSSMNLSSLSTNLEDIVYNSIVFALQAPNKTEDYTNHRYSMAKIIMNRNVADNETPDRELLYQPDEIDNDIQVSFIQMMTKLYATNNKEFNESEYDKYKNLFSIYMKITTSFFAGITLGMVRSSEKRLRQKSKEIRSKYNKAQLTFIDVLCDILNGGNGY